MGSSDAVKVNLRPIARALVVVAMIATGLFVLSPQPVSAMTTVNMFGNTTPTNADFHDGTAYTLGMQFSSDTPGRVMGVRFYKGTNNTGTHVGKLWTMAQDELASVTFTGETATGWQQALFSKPVVIQINTTYMISYEETNGYYSYDSSYFDSGHDNGPLHAPTSAGAYHTGSIFPDGYTNLNYWVDPIFEPNYNVPNAPSSLAQYKSDGTTAISTGSIVNETRVTLKATVSDSDTGDSDGICVEVKPIGVAFDDTALACSNLVATGSTASVEISGLADNTSYHWQALTRDAANQLSTWASYGGNSDTVTAATDFTVQSTGYGFTAMGIIVPTTIDTPDPASYTLGTKFSSDVDGEVTGVRFYKGWTNTSTHVGRLWTAGGVELASVTFSNESAAGWQTAYFPTPVTITASTTYVISYEFTGGGGYAGDGGFFASGYDNAPLHMPIDAGVYDSGGPGIFPDTLAWTEPNYYVDPIFDYNIAPDAPTSLAQYKSDGTTSIATGNWTNETEVVLKGTVTDDNDNDTDSLCVEVKAVTSAFTNTDTACGTGVAQGGSASVSVTGLSSGTAYHWQARTKDADGAYSSSWASYGGNSDVVTAATDFRVDSTSPIAGTVNDGTGADVTFNDGSLSSLSANWSGFSDSLSGIASYDYAIGTTSGGTQVLNWTSNALSTSITANAATLRTGVTYYVSVRANDAVGNSTIVASNGQSVLPSFSSTVVSSAITPTLSAANGWTGGATVTVTTSTNAYNGYNVRAYMPSPLTSPSAATITGFGGGTYAAPDSWQAGDTGFGYTSDDTSVAGSNRFQGSPCTGGSAYASPGCFAAFSGTSPGDIVADHPGPIAGVVISNEVFTVTLRMTIPSNQTAGQYLSSIRFGVAPSY